MPTSGWSHYSLSVLPNYFTSWTTSLSVTNPFCRLGVGRSHGLSKYYLPTFQIGLYTQLLESSWLLPTSLVCIKSNQMLQSLKSCKTSSYVLNWLNWTTGMPTFYNFSRNFFFMWLNNLQEGVDRCRKLVFFPPLPAGWESSPTQGVRWQRDKAKHTQLAKRWSW